MVIPRKAPSTLKGRAETEKSSSSLSGTGSEIFQGVLVFSLGNELWKITVAVLEKPSTSHARD